MGKYTPLLKIPYKIKEVRCYQPHFNFLPKQHHCPEIRFSWGPAVWIHWVHSCSSRAQVRAVVGVQRIIPDQLLSLSCWDWPQFTCQGHRTPLIDVLDFAIGNLVQVILKIISDSQEWVTGFYMTRKWLLGILQNSKCIVGWALVPPRTYPLCL